MCWVNVHYWLLVIDTLKFLNKQIFPVNMTQWSAMYYIDPNYQLFVQFFSLIKHFSFSPLHINDLILKWDEKNEKNAFFTKKNVIRCCHASSGLKVDPHETQKWKKLYWSFLKIFLRRNVFHHHSYLKIDSRNVLTVSVSIYESMCPNC